MTADECAGCGGPHPFDTSVPSVAWNAVIRRSGLADYLCASCILKAFVKAGRSFTAVLWNDEFDGVPIEIRIREQGAIDAQSVQDENNALRAELTAMRAAIEVPRQPVVKSLSNDTSIICGLFQGGAVSLHSGGTSAWKIECDALSQSDIDTLAIMLAERLPPFGCVEGVPRGGLLLAAALAAFATEGPLLIVDDVLTTGRSLESHRRGREAIGAVIFARSHAPAWVTPLFQMPTLPVQSLAQPSSVDAVDPHAADPGKLTTRD